MRECRYRYRSLLNASRKSEPSCLLPKLYDNVSDHSGHIEDAIEGQESHGTDRHKPTYEGEKTWQFLISSP